MGTLPTQKQAVRAGIVCRVLLAWLLLCPLVSWGQSTSLVISQVYGGGGNSGATYTNDFIEIHNVSGAAISLAGYSLQYAPSTSSSWTRADLSGSIPAGGYYLIQANGGATGSPLPAANATISVNLAANTGKVALVSATTTLSTNCPTADIIDFVGYGTGTDCSEGAVVAVGSISATNSLQRNSNGCTDTNQNNLDFTIAAATPRNSGTPVVLCTTGTATAPTVTTAAPTNVTTTSATVGGNVANDNGAPVTSRGVVYGTSPNPQLGGGATQVTATPATGTGAFSITLTGLNPGTLYYVNTYATNSAGTSYGTANSFTTDATPPPTITSISPTSGPPTTVVTINGTDFSQARITGVLFGSTPAASYNVVSSTLITATVAAGTTTGPVAVTDGVTVTGPTFTVTAPTIVVSTTSLSSFSTTQGTPSAARSYTVRGDGVGNDNVVVNAPAGYEVSSVSATGPFFTTVPLVPNSAGNVPTTTIYVRLTGTNQGTFTGFVDNDSRLATKQQVSVTGTVSPAATLNVTPASLSGFTALVGQNSTAQSYTVTGSNLPGPVTVSAPVGYEVATAIGGPYQAILTLPLSGSGINQTIYVRLRNTIAAGTYNGGVSNASGAVARTVTVSGTTTTGPLAPEPTTVGTLTIGTTTANSVTVGVTAGNGTGRLLLVRQSSPVDADPIDGLTYTASPAYGAGSEIATLNYVVLSGSATSVTVTGLVPGTQYSFKLFEYRGTGSTTNYLTTTTASVSTTTQVAAATTGPGEMFLEEGFAYAPGTVLTNTGNWTQIGANTNNAIQNDVGSLTFSMYGTPSTVGTAAFLNNDGQDIERAFAPALTSGDLYVSFVVNVSAIGANNEYFFGLKQQGSATYPGKIYVGTGGVAGTYKLGLGFNTAAPVYATDVSNATINFNFNTPYLVVLRYRRIAGPSNDQMRLYVLSGGTPVAEPTVSQVPDITIEAGDTEMSPNAVALRQYSASQSIAVDGIRVGNGWGAVVGRPRFISNQFGLRAGNYYDVELNLPTNTSTVAATGNVAIESRLWLTQGRLVTTNENLLTLRAGALSDAGTADSFVDGPMAWTYLDNDTKEFPLGHDGVFRPVRLNINQVGVATYRMTMTNQAAPDYGLPANITRRSTVRYYTLNRIAGTASATSGQITLNYGTDDGVADPNFLRVLRSENGDPYTDEGPVSGGSASPIGSIRSELFLTDFTFQNIFTLGNQTPGTNPLPVELLSFTGMREAAGVRLRWATASEKNSAWFDVQRSADGKQFATVARVEGQGLSTRRHDYNALDRQPLAGSAYYRLRQVDQDGKASFSPVVLVGSASELALFPNPTSGTLSIRLPQSLSSGTPRIRIADLTGRVMQEQVLAESGEVDLSRLQAGTYIVLVGEGSQQMTRKVVKY